MSDYKKLFELKQEEWIEICKEVDVLTAENANLKRIIAKELTENDELGSEFVYVQALKERLKLAEQMVSELREHLMRAGIAYPAPNCIKIINNGLSISDGFVAAWEKVR